MQGPQQTQEVLAAFNSDLIATGVVSAWLEAFGALRNRFQIPGSPQFRPCFGIYKMVPSGSDGADDEKETLATKRAAKSTKYIATQVTCLRVCTAKYPEVCPVQALARMSPMQWVFHSAGVSGNCEEAAVAAARWPHGESEPGLLHPA